MLALVEQGLHLVAIDAQGLGGRIQIEPVPGLVLDLGHQDRLAMESRCP